MLRPSNAVAEQVDRLRSVNGDIDVQIGELQAAKSRNGEAIAALEPFAEWHEVPDPDPAPMPAAPVVETSDVVALDPAD